MSRRLPALGLLLLVGCGGPPAPAGTGAREAAADYFEALARRDWPAAHDKLAPESRQRFGREVFAGKAQAYRKALGFDLAKVHLRSCEEQGDRAVAHLTLADAADTRKNSYRESVVLRRGPEGSGVVLPKNFGK